MSLPAVGSDRKHSHPLSASIKLIFCLLKRESSYRRAIMPKISKFFLGISNMYLVQDRGTIIVDTGSEKTREKYLEVFSGAGIKPEDVTLIVVTHGHTDHFSFAGEFKKMTGAPVLCHSLAVKALKTGNNPEFVARKEEGKEFLEFISHLDLTAYGTVEPDLTFDSEFDLTPYGVQGKVIHTPGHSDCSTSLVLASGEAFVGDMLIDSPFTGEMRLPFLATDESRLFKSYGRLLGVTDIFFGGHGIPLSKKEMLELIRKDNSPEGKKMLDEYYRSGC
jgi:hydroxyacylglutathione hydrolase